MGKPVKWHREFFFNKSVENVLKRLEPYKPKKLILGKHFIPKGSYHINLTANKKDEHEHSYRGIPIEVSENEYELDFEI